MEEQKQAREKQPIAVLRERRGGMSAEMKAYYERFKEVRKLLKAALAEGFATVPQLAAATKLPSAEVLWHVMALREYGLVREGEQRGDYLTYALKNEE
jgi:DNA-binding transcriptional ArsR family regulator